MAEVVWADLLSGWVVPQLPILLCGTEGDFLSRASPQCHSAPSFPHSHCVPGAVEEEESHRGHQLGPVRVG